MNKEKSMNSKINLLEASSEAGMSETKKYSYLKLI
jgi:hypothetical protein